MRSVLIVSVASIFVAIVIFLLTTVIYRALRLRSEKRKEVQSGKTRGVAIRISSGDASDSDLDLLTKLDAELLNDVLGGILAKIKGDAKNQLVAALDSKGIIENAIGRTKRIGIIGRCKAGAFLGNIGNPKALSTLISMLEDRSLEVRTVAAKSLGQIMDPSAVKPLFMGLDDKKRQLPFSTVIVAVLRIGSQGLNEIIDSLEQASERQRSAAVEVLGLLGAIESVAKLIERLEFDSSLDVRIRCIRALGRIGTHRALEPIANALSSSNPREMRLVACGALGQLGDKRAVTHLFAITEDIDTEIARAASLALSRLGEAGILALMSTIDSGSKISSIAREAIIRMEIQNRALEESGTISTHATNLR